MPTDYEKICQDNINQLGDEFAIYEWRFPGIREDLVLKAVTSSEPVTACLGRLLEKAMDASTPDPVNHGPQSQVWATLDSQLYTLWNEAREKHISADGRTRSVSQGKPVNKPSSTVRIT